MRRVRPRLTSIVVATVVAASSLAAWAPPASAGTDAAAQRYWPRVWAARFTDKSGDAFLGGTNADLRDVGAIYRGDKVTLEASTYGGTDPRTHDMWRDGSLVLAWFLDTNGDGTDDWEVDYGNDGQGLVAEVVNLATDEVACEGEPVTSMKELLGREISLAEVADRVVARFAEVFDMTVEVEGAARV